MPKGTHDKHHTTNNAYRDNYDTIFSSKKDHKAEALSDEDLRWDVLASTTDNLTTAVLIERINTFESRLERKASILQKRIDLTQAYVDNTSFNLIEKLATVTEENKKLTYLIEYAENNTENNVDIILQDKAL